MPDIDASFQCQYRLHRRKYDGMRRTGIGTGRASDDTVEWLDNDRLLAVKIKAIHESGATGNAGAAADAGIFNDGGIPLNMLARHAMPGLDELRVRHDGNSLGAKCN